MHNLKKILAILLAFVMTFAACLALSSCGNPSEDEDDGSTQAPPQDENGDIKYTILVKDYYGNAYEGVAPVEIFKGEESVGMARISGGAATKTLPKDNYTFKIDFDGEYIYDESKAQLTPESATAEIVIFNSLGEGMPLAIPCNHKDANNDCVCDSCSRLRHPADDDANGACDVCGTQKHTDKNGDEICDDKNCRCGFLFFPYESGGYSATGIYEGASIVTIDRPEMSYFIFTPESSGTYKFTCVIDGEFEFGNYGDPNFIQSNSTVEVTNGSFESIVREGSLGSGTGGRLHIVIGVASQSAKTAVIIVERLGDAPVDMPYTEIHADKNKQPYDDVLNDSLVDINIKENVTVVLNPVDGYYHLGSADGPLVLVKISAMGNSNLSGFEFPSFVKICETDNMCCYFYDTDGNLVRKEIYNFLITEYAELAGSRGLIPLDEKIANAIKNTGEHNGWWKKSGEGANYIFGSNNVNVDSAWLFACAYVSTGTNGTSSKPINVTPTEDAVNNAIRVGTKETYVKVYTSGSGNSKLVFSDAENVTIKVGSTTYTADTNGVIEITVPAGATFTVTATESGVLHFTCQPA